MRYVKSYAQSSEPVTDLIVASPMITQKGVAGITYIALNGNHIGNRYFQTVAILECIINGLCNQHRTGQGHSYC